MRTAAARLALLCTLALPACATAATGSGGGRSDLITQEEMQSHHFLNAYEAVQALHANWLVKRGPSSANLASDIVVYEDLARAGGIETLREMSTMNIKYIQHYNADEATSRWGVGHSEGAILVSTMSK